MHPKAIAIKLSLLSFLTGLALVASCSDGDSEMVGGDGNFDTLTLSSIGGMPGPRHDGDECDNMHGNVMTVAASQAGISWDLCTWPTVDSPHMTITKGSRSLTPAELGTVKESLQHVRVGNGGHCGFDKPIVTLDIEGNGSIGHYVDDFYGCNPPPSGRTFVTGIDWVESAVGKLVP
jgi:hypothetical protein